MISFNNRIKLATGSRLLITIVLPLTVIVQVGDVTFISIVKHIPLNAVKTMISVNNRIKLCVYHLNIVS